ncbi:hypothetical protein [Lentzea kentuckyensis]|uniref:hypothetical protein n=1 Tax=Lentzea kentuckyensis TaxID=360086 RepID=UPI000A3BB670|nr:hypothetical protein [Lentzea kentuckyensis]
MRSDDHVDLFRKPDDGAGAEPVASRGSSPRGLTSAGWVRTTGWLQFGDHPVSSAHLAALAGLLWGVVGAAVLIRAHPVAAGVLVASAPALCGGSWWLLTAVVWPASSACNIGRKPVDELVPGDLVRLHGSIGPVGQVAAVTFGDDVRVAFHGGGCEVWPRRQEVHLVELLN